MLKLNLADCVPTSQRNSKCTFVGFSGQCYYYHYGQQGIDDRGWGCGYRTLQMILSWYQLTRHLSFILPNLYEIQEILHRIEDKPQSFMKSHEWIGSFECGLVINYLTKCDFRILNLPNGCFSNDDVVTIMNHFTYTGSPIMMGGRDDNSSKGVLAVRTHPTEPTQLLVCDPHLYAVSDEPNINQLLTNGWLRWCDITELTEKSFYNLCMPL